MNAKLLQPEVAQAQREEVEWLLTSGALGRSANIARVLRFICDEHFAGRGEQIKEYTIAVEALSRRTDFDPQTDTIVRVTVHSLRKRLQDLYENEGTARPLRILIPPGHYIPHFLPNAASPLVQVHASLPDPPVTPAEAVSGPSSAQLPPAFPPHVEAPLSAVPKDSEVAHRSRRLVALLVLAACAIAVVGLLILRHDQAGAAPSRPADLSLPAPRPGQAQIHALMGPARADYMDHNGERWSAAAFCDGGTDVRSTGPPSINTEDPSLYSAGVRGIARCMFPVKAQMYEVHFYFAEPSDLPVATRVAQLSINAGPPLTFDVVDEAGGVGRAISTVVTGVAPENDGSIHVDYISEVSLLTAVEILPAPSTKLLPVRIVASSSAVHDDAGQLWFADRFFSGGRHGQVAATQSGTHGSIYDSNRIGRFAYQIPVAPLSRYRIRLYFREPWFGPGNGGKGGPGSRVFDVACNGSPLLQKFDILAEGHGQPVVRTFDNIQANATGRLDINFLPEVNYPIVNAIEVIPM